MNDKSIVDQPGDTRAPGKPTRMQRLAPPSWLVRSVFQASMVLGTVVLSIFLLGLAQRTGWLAVADSHPTSADDADSGPPKRYICPMMCVPPTTQPGNCPVCGMDLVVASSGGAGGSISVEIEPAVRRILGIQTAVAQQQTVSRTIRTIGSIDFDESRLATISAYVDGRLETMYADYVGVPVNQGDDVALLYSPDLFSAQAEFTSALTSPSIGRSGSRISNRANLLEMATDKLTELGMSAEQIDELKRSGAAKSRIRIKSPQKGTVIEKLAVEGDYLKTGQAIYRVADLSTVWMMLELFPDDAALVRFGQEVEAEISSAAGDVFTGRIAFISPTISKKTQTVRIRVEMLNLDGKLRPGEYATARIKVPAISQDRTYDPALAGKYISPMHPQVIRDAPGTCPICDMELIPTTQLGFSTEPIAEHESITIPRDALLMAGSNSVVYVESEPGRFEVRRVGIGGLTDQVAILAHGLDAGEIVATQGNFLLDSQSQLNGSPSLLDPSKAPTEPPSAKRPPDSPIVEIEPDNPFEGMEVQSLDFE